MPPPPLEDLEDEREQDEKKSTDEGEDGDDGAVSDAPPHDNGTAATADDDDDDDDDGGDEDEFIVEKIVKHVIDKEGELRFYVKWEGYDDPADMTWEPEENLAAAPAILEEYYDRVGGRKALFEKTEQKKAALNNKRKRGRPSMAGPSDGSTKKSRQQHPGDSTPPRNPDEFQLPSGSWENDVADIDVLRGDEGDAGDLIVYLTWKNGKKTRHTTSTVYKRLPQKMLRYYESHVRIYDVSSADGPAKDEMDS